MGRAIGGKSGTVTYFLTCRKASLACVAPRISGIVVPGLTLHVTQRGNNRRDVFLTDADRVADVASPP
jgi:hypothetical protein